MAFFPGKRMSTFGSKLSKSWKPRASLNQLREKIRSGISCSSFTARQGDTLFRERKNWITAAFPARERRFLAGRKAVTKQKENQILPAAARALLDQRGS